MYVKLGLSLIAALLPAYLLRFSIGPLPSTALEVMILIITALWLWETRGKISWRIPRPWTIGMLAMLAAATVAVFIAPNHWAALGIWRAYFLEPMILFVIAVHVLKNKQDVQNLFSAFAVGGLAVSIVAIIQFITGAGIPKPWDVERRVTSLFPFPNAVGLYLGPIIMIGAANLLKNSGKKWLWAVTVLLGLVATIMAQSEAAIAAVIITSFILLLLDKRTRRFAAAAAVVTIIVVAAIAPLRTFLWQKATLQDFSGEVRRAMWSETVEMLKDRPLLGAGLSGYKTAVAPYHRHPEWEIFQYPHQIILNIWTELGVLGLVVFAALAILVVRSTFATSETHATFVTPESLAAFAALFEMTLHGLVDVPYFKNDLATMTWLLLAALVVLHYERPNHST